MIVIKYISFIFIFMTSIIIGRLMSKKYVDRVKELKYMKNALNIFKSKIKFTYEPIGEVFEEIATSMNNNIGDIFADAKDKMSNRTASSAWESAVEHSDNNLNNEDKQTIKLLSKLLRSNRFRGTNKSNRSNRRIHR